MNYVICMEKFKWFDQEREYDVSSENKIVLEAIDVLINNVVKNKNFNNLLEDLTIAISIIV